MKVYLILNDEPLDRRSILLVGSKKDAERLVECEYAITYEEIEVCDKVDVNEIIEDYMLSRG